MAYLLAAEWRSPCITGVCGGRFAIGGWAGGHRGGSPWPRHGALTASALEPTNGGERRAKKIPLRATGPLRKPHVLRFRNSRGRRRTHAPKYGNLGYGQRADARVSR